MNVKSESVLINIWAPHRTMVINSLLVVGASLVTALSAQIVILLPFTPVPITGQTAAVLLSGGLLGARLGFASQLLYLFAGAIGLPFFADGAGGYSILLGPTAGYLVGFPIASFIVGYLVNKGWNKSILKTWLTMVIAETTIFLPGLLVLSLFIPTSDIIGKGLLPFLPGALIKDLFIIALLFEIPKLRAYPKT